MSNEFSETIKKYLDKQNVKITELARYCEYDRPTMYQIINGKRKPVSLQQVNRISSFLNLSPRDNHELVKAYFETIEGPIAYAESQSVVEFIINLNRDVNRSSYSWNFSSNQGLIPDNLTILNNGAAVNSAVTHIMNVEELRDNPHLAMVLQPGSETLFELINYGDSNGCFKIDHYLCIDNSTETTAASFYNIHSLENILKLLGSHPGYQAKCYYNDTEARFDNLSLFPFAILSSDAVIVLNSNCTSGFCSSDQNMVSLYRKKIKEFDENSRPVLSRIDGIFEQVQLYMGLMSSGPGLRTIEAIPCMLAWIDREILNRCILGEGSEREQSIGFLNDYLEQCRQTFMAGTTFSIFSENGLDYFLETGTSPEIPDDFYSPLMEEDRLTVLKRMIPYAEKGQYRLAKRELTAMEPRLDTCITLAGNALLIQFNSNGLHMAMIREPKIVSIFQSFFDNLDHYDYLYSIDETVQMLEDRISRLSEQPEAAVTKA